MTVPMAKVRDSASMNFFISFVYGCLCNASMTLHNLKGLKGRMFFCFE